MKFEVTETRKMWRTVEIEADTMEQAIEKARQLYSEDWSDPVEGDLFYDAINIGDDDDGKDE